MSWSLEDLLDATLDTRHQRRLQHEAELTLARQAIDAAHAKIEDNQRRFHTEVRQLVQRAVGRANRHLAKRPERCEFCDVSGHYTGPLHVGGSVCNPIAYELHADDATVGETLLIELTHDGMVEAALCKSAAFAKDTHLHRMDLGWHPVRLELFNAATAAGIVVWYVAAIAKRWPLGNQPPSQPGTADASGNRVEASGQP